MVNFCVAILILKVGENKQHFRHIMLYYFKKGKNTTETQENICTVMEKVLGLIKHVKSFLLEISRWTMLHGRVGQLRLIAIKLRH